MSKVDICIPTIDRPHALERMLLSVAAHHPDASVHVGDQSERFDPDFHAGLGERLREAGLRRPPTVHRFPFDCGVSAARNHLVDASDAPYLLIVDDDGVFTEDTDIDALTRLLDAQPRAGAVAGVVLRSGRTVFSGCDLEVRGATLFQLPHSGRWQEAEGIRFTQVDCVPNCAVMRRELFDHVRWDPALKTAGEHFDFYLRMKQTPYTVLHTPDVAGEHPPLDSDAPYRDLRLRAEFVVTMLRKHNLTRIEMLDGTVLELDPGRGLVRHLPGAAPASDSTPTPST